MLGNQDGLCLVVDTRNGNFQKVGYLMKDMQDCVWKIYTYADKVQVGTIYEPPESVEWGEQTGVANGQTGDLYLAIFNQKKKIGSIDTEGQEIFYVRNNNGEEVGFVTNGCDVEEYRHDVVHRHTDFDVFTQGSAAIALLFGK